jgi:hypothetical protein
MGPLFKRFIVLWVPRLMRIFRRSSYWVVFEDEHERDNEDDSLKR